MSFKVICITAILTCISSVLFAQEEPSGPVFSNMIDVISPAPNAASIIKYNYAALNKNTGAPAISIPLYTLSGNKLSTSISLGYSSSGIRVDEISSRVGMGWSINAGGVVTRTIRGVPDETGTRRYPWGELKTPPEPIDENWSTYYYMRLIAQAHSVHGADAEPDLFNYSFDGFSGSFILDFGTNNIMVPKLINKNGLKIQVDFQSNDWNIKITNKQGTVYVFGGSSATEKTKSETNCNKNTSLPVPTAWYLKEIQHVNGEKIILTYSPHSYKYDNGVSQTMYDLGFVENTCGCQELSPDNCVSFIKTDGVLLQTIQSPGYGSLSFLYADRQDCEDKLIFRISKIDQSNNTISTFHLNHYWQTSSSVFNNEVLPGHNYTPYLENIEEHFPGTSQKRTHFFSYIDRAGRPSRLSFSQDHWGFFNGKVNSTLVPALGGTYTNSFPDATANKDPDPMFAQKGLLQKIVFPTGGINMFFYEPNQYNVNNPVDTYTTAHEVTCEVTGEGLNTELYKLIPFSLGVSQNVTLITEIIENPGHPHQTGGVQILDLGGASVLDQFYPTEVKYLTAGNYKMKVRAVGQGITTNAILKFKGPIHTDPSSDNRTIVGGLRVSKTLTGNATEAPIIKKYYYGNYSNLNTSSLAGMDNPDYLGGDYRDVSCQVPVGQTFRCGYLTLNSSSLRNLSIYNGGLASYGSVVESIGDNFQGGGIESKFFINGDVRADRVWRNDVLHAPRHNFSSLYCAKPYTETLLKKMSDGSLKPIKKTEFHYKRDMAADEVFYGFTVLARSEGAENTVYDSCITGMFLNTGMTCMQALRKIMSKYNMVRWRIHSSWVYPDWKTETVYDENGDNPVESKVNYYYDNAQHLNLSRSEVNNSKGNKILRYYKYPPDFPSNTLLSSMTAMNIVDPVIYTEEDVKDPSQNILAATTNTVSYNNVGNNNYLPVSIEKKINTGEPFLEGTINLYDDNGNILQYTDKAGIVSSIIWGYGYKYPVAKIIGIGYATALSYLTIPVSTLQTLDGSALRTELNRIRVDLTAQVTSYTYKPHSGITSVTDPNNNTQTYEYDELNNLIIVRDPDNNIIKKHEYTYAVANPGTTFYFYYNEATTPQSFQCNSCENGFVGTSVNYSVPMGRYYSLVSQQDADDMAQADVLANGQLNANKLGKCSNVGTCIGDAFKFINCTCEVAVDTICMGANIVHSNGTWTRQFRYVWSDGSQSVTYGDLMPPCTGVGKKLMPCECETGQVVSCVTTETSPGVYEVSYKYRWSDNSESSTITETINCAGENKQMINCECKTGIKIYTLSEQELGVQNTGCPLTHWKCTYHYSWGSGVPHSANYTECSFTNCIPVAD